jgi:hypothetical protein
MESIDGVRAGNLLALIDSKFDGSQTKFSAAIGHDRPTQVNHWLRGFKKMSNASARLIETKLGLPDFAFDQPGFIEVFAEHGFPTVSAKSLDEVTRNEAAHRVRGVLSGPIHPDAVRFFAHRLDLERKTTADEPVLSLELSRPAARKLIGGDDPTNVRIFAMPGDSMAPTIGPQDLTFIDLAVSTFDRDGIYLFSFGDSTFLKRLQRVGSKVAVISDNAAYSTWHIEEEDLDRLQLIARVLSTVPLSSARVFV